MRDGAIRLRMGDGIGIVSGYKKIKLTRGHYAIVDAEDYEYLIQWKWCSSKEKNLYAVRFCKDNRKSRMHRVIMKAKKGECVDHVNHNGLDNRKKNLRICNNQQNTFNSKKRIGRNNYKGAHRIKNSNNWYSDITVDGHRIYLGKFPTENLAARAYNKAAKKYYGKFVCLNKIRRVN